MPIKSAVFVPDAARGDTGFRPNPAVLSPLRDAIARRPRPIAPVTIDEILALAPVMPTLAFQDATDARRIAEALVRGGLRAIEVRLPGAAAIEAIAEIAQIEGVIVGAGLVTSERQLDQAIAAGARFITSPGLTDTFGAAVVERAIPFLPGVTNAGDIMRGLELSLDHFQYGPADVLGLPLLKAVAASFRQCRFCPAGGITPATAPAWLAEKVVTCVTGSWLVEPGTPDPAAIEQRARAAFALR